MVFLYFPIYVKLDELSSLRIFGKIYESNNREKSNPFSVKKEIFK